MQKKKGISLIVLVITIIVMIILAAAVVISISNTGVIERAGQAVDLTDEKQVQDLAALIWADAYLDPDKKEDIVNVVKEALEKEGITENEWNIKVSNTGIEVSKWPGVGSTGVGNPPKKTQKSTVIKVNKQHSDGCDYTYQGKTMTFENVEINSTENTGMYPGFVGMNATFTDCVINGTLALYGDCTFVDCEFNISGDKYNLWTWNGSNVTFQNCTFNSDGKAILVYGAKNTTVTVKNCLFNDNGGLTDLKAAIEIGNDYNVSYNLTVNNTVVNGYEINNKGINTGTTLWANKNSMGTDKLNVVVDGVEVY
ncbi:MAG: right-handed parallel beta-helix repeat-containing protein [Clostridia bacterium]|nr:right-handed parallel beta-helix repeat-containing protein [Clostridia bacterium]